MAAESEAEALERVREGFVLRRTVEKADRRYCQQRAAGHLHRGEVRRQDDHAAAARLRLAQVLDALHVEELRQALRRAPPGEGNLEKRNAETCEVLLQQLL